MSQPVLPARSRWPLQAAWIVCLGVAVWLLIDDVQRPVAAPRADPASGAATKAATAAIDGDRQAGEPSALQRREFDASTLPGIAGRLLQGGAPLAGATVCTDEDGAVAGSAADGTFFLPQCSGSIDLTVRGASVPPGFSLGHVIVTDGERFDVGDVIVPRGAAIVGRVVDEQGQPLAGICVHAAGVGAYTYPFAPDAKETSPSDCTGADGRFRLHDLLPGKFTVYVDHPDRELSETLRDAKAVVESGGRADVGDLVLQRVGPLRGFVLDGSGHPVADAQVVPGGGEYSERQPRRAARTGADGGFVLRGFGASKDLTIEAAGFETLTCAEVQAAAQPFLARLQPALVLTGSVQGTGGQPGVVRVEPDPVVYREWHPWVHRILSRAWSIPADGSFCIVGLPAGRWSVRALVPGVGRVPFVTCEVPQQQPLLLTIEPGRVVTVQVVDELGSPVGGARVSQGSLIDADDLEAAALPQPGMDADAGGRAVLRVSPTWKWWIRGSAPGHCSGKLEFEVDELPDVVTLQLPRAGRLHGHVAAGELRTQAHLWLHCVRLDGSDRGSSIRTDSCGSFRSGPLAPGRYRLTLVVADAGEGGWSWEPPVPQPVPPLVDQIEVGGAVQVDVVAGEDTAVVVAAPQVGELRGRVLAHGAPVAGAIVFALRDQGEEEPYLLPVQLDTGRGRVFCRTDADGRFRFLAPTTGSFRLRARHAQGAAWCSPVVVQVPMPGAIVPCELRLGAAAIHGSFDLRETAPIERCEVHASLFRLQDAAIDPGKSLWTMDASKHLEDTVQQVPLPASGAFAFECLPPGGWVLRLVGRHGILLQRVVHTVGDETIELGALQVPAGVEPELGCGLTPENGVQLLQCIDGAEVFLRALFAREGEGFRWGTLPPGRYRLRATEMLQVQTSLGESWREPGDPVGEPVDVEVHKDGSCTPPVVWPDGLEE